MARKCCFGMEFVIIAAESWPSGLKRLTENQVVPRGLVGSNPTL